MISATTLVDDHPAHYATGGRWLPVLFLHGWGLDHRAYQRSLKRLTARNCRVFAPSLPGFGGEALGRPQPSTLRRVARSITISGTDQRSQPEVAVAAGV